jgi:hypothetical protein
MAVFRQLVIESLAEAIARKGCAEVLNVVVFCDAVGWGGRVGPRGMRIARKQVSGGGLHPEQQIRMPAVRASRFPLSRSGACVEVRKRERLNSRDRIRTSPSDDESISHTSTS